MMRFRKVPGRTILIWALMTFCGFGMPGSLLAGPGQGKSAIDFNRQVLPILAENCFACHGPDGKKREGKLRLDTKAGAFAKLEDEPVIVAGKPDESTLIQRIESAEADELMPPAKTGKKLSATQKEILRQWIVEGANWSEHWAWVAPRRSVAPPVSDANWVRQPIDRFILARLDAHGLRPSPEANRATLIRRVTLDLTGLPPTPAEVSAFGADPSPDAYERVVDRLLKSPHFGEHLARHWLDAARYADTHGLHLDNYREMWLYREWVINAFNRNLKYDHFIIEQLAGDLLPKATMDQIVASGYNRCNVTTAEGGSIAEECYVRNVVDRVDTLGTVFLGLSLGCARCHEHKYDPLSMKDYYQVFAFFNSLDDDPMDGNAARHAPILRVASKAQLAGLAKLDGQVKGLTQRIVNEVARTKYEANLDPPNAKPRQPAEYVWIEDDLPAGATAPKPAWEFVEAPLHPVHSGKRSLKRSGTGLHQSYFEKAQPGLRIGAGDKLFAYVYLDPKHPPKEIMLQWHTDAWKHRAYWGANRIDWGADNSTERKRLGDLPTAGKWVPLEVPAETVGLKPGMVVTGFAFTQFDGTAYWDKTGCVTRMPQHEPVFDNLTTWLDYQEAVAGAELPRQHAKLVKLARAQRSAAQQKELFDYFIEHAWTKSRAVFRPLHQQLGELRKQRDQLDSQIPATLVSKERQDPRPSYILRRGEYDQRQEKVERVTPAAFFPLPASAPKNRLGFARWLVDRQHPLTARVAVNRFWQQLFGAGIVSSSDDFGTQGERPSHPELLDWLAVEFQDTGWDVKRLMKLLVTSATYRQSSKVTADLLAKDPANRLLSRGPRIRLDAEMLRDQALAASGLLVKTVGGPSIKPPQPAGLWEAVGYTSSNTARFVADVGHDKVHRRSLYIFWKRTSAPPQLTTFDAPSREACAVRRERTNTPLQALLMLNETQYVEAARHLAERTLRRSGRDPADQLIELFQAVTARSPDAKELAELLALKKDLEASFANNPSAAAQLIQVGATKPDPKLNGTELAVWTMITNTVFNLDEVVNKN